MEKKPEIKMNPVKSSNISHCGHCPKTNTLAVQFKSGAVYHYHGVDAKQFSSLMSAESIGKHLNGHVKGKHKHTKI